MFSVNQIMVGGVGSIRSPFDVHVYVLSLIQWRREMTQATISASTGSVVCGSWRLLSGATWHRNVPAAADQGRLSVGRTRTEISPSVIARTNRATSISPSQIGLKMGATCVRRYLAIRWNFRKKSKYMYYKNYLIIINLYSTTFQFKKSNQTTMIRLWYETSLVNKKV